MERTEEQVRADLKKLQGEVRAAVSRLGELDVLKHSTMDRIRELRAIADDTFEYARENFGEDFKIEI